MAEQATLEAPVKVAPAKSKKKYVFQVLGGRHWEPGEVTDDTGKTVVKDIKYGPGCPFGDIVETDVELDKRFNRPNFPPKFRRLGEEGVRDAQAEEVRAERQQKNTAQAALRSALERMPRDALVQWAEEQKIDLRGAVKRDDVLRTILGTLGA